MARTSLLLLLLQGMGMMCLATTTAKTKQTDMSATPLFSIRGVLAPPYLMIDSTVEGGSSSNENYVGFVKDLLQTLSSMVGFDYELSIQQDQRYGSPRPDGSWTGMIGALIRKEIDIAVGPITMSLMRARVVDFSVPFQTFERVAIVKDYSYSTPPPNDFSGPAPFSLSERLSLLLSPFEHSVWLLTGLSWLVSSLVLYLVCRANPYEWRQMVKDREATLREGESFNCVNSYWFTIGAIFWQGFMRSPRSMGGRIVVTTWWIFSLIFVATYISSLTCLLQSGPISMRKQAASQDAPKNPRILSFQDIADNPNITIGAYPNGATFQYFRTSKLSVASQIANRMNKFENPILSLADGIERVRQSTPEQPFVYFGESVMAKYFIGQEPCGLYTVSGLGIGGFFSFAFPIGSSLRTQMGLAMLRIKESGTLAALENKWFSGGCKTDILSRVIAEKEKITPTPVQYVYHPFRKIDLASFSGALIVLIVGLCLGSLVTLVEKLLFASSERGDPVETNTKA